MSSENNTNTSSIDKEIDTNNFERQLSATSSAIKSDEENILPQYRKFSDFEQDTKSSIKSSHGKTSLQSKQKAKLESKNSAEENTKHEIYLKKYSNKTKPQVNSLTLKNGKASLNKMATPSYNGVQKNKKLKLIPEIMDRLLASCIHTIPDVNDQYGFGENQRVDISQPPILQSSMYLNTKSICKMLEAVCENEEKCSQNGMPDQKSSKKSSVNSAQQSLPRKKTHSSTNVPQQYQEKMFHQSITGKSQMNSPNFIPNLNTKERITNIDGKSFFEVEKDVWIPHVPNKQSLFWDEIPHFQEEEEEELELNCFVPSHEYQDQNFKKDKIRQRTNTNKKWTIIKGKPFFEKESDLWVPYENENQQYAKQNPSMKTLENKIKFLGLDDIPTSSLNYGGKSINYSRKTSRRVTSIQGKPFVEIEDDVFVPYQFGQTLPNEIKTEKDKKSKNSLNHLLKSKSSSMESSSSVVEKLTQPSIASKLYYDLDLKKRFTCINGLSLLEIENDVWVPYLPSSTKMKNSLNDPAFHFERISHFIEGEELDLSGIFNSDHEDNNETFYNDIEDSKLVEINGKLYIHTENDTWMPYVPSKAKTKETPKVPDYSKEKISLFMSRSSLDAGSINSDDKDIELNEKKISLGLSQKDSSKRLSNDKTVCTEKNAVLRKKTNSASSLQIDKKSESRNVTSFSQEYPQNHLEASSVANEKNSIHKENNPSFRETSESQPHISENVVKQKASYSNYEEKKASNEMDQNREMKNYEMNPLDTELIKKAKEKPGELNMKDIKGELYFEVEENVWVPVNICCTNLSDDIEASNRKMGNDPVYKSIINSGPPEWNLTWSSLFLPQSSSTTRNSLPPESLIIKQNSTNKDQIASNSLNPHYDS